MKRLVEVVGRPMLGGLAALLASIAAPGPGYAQNPELSPTELERVVLIYAAGVADLDAIYAACAPDMAEGWAEGRALVLATLEGAGLASPALRRIEAALDAGSPLEVDCSGPEVQLFTGLGNDATWSDYHRIALEALGLEIVAAAPDDDARVEALRAYLATETDLQAAMMACMAVLDPRGYMLVYSDWNNLMATVAQDLTTHLPAGLAAELVASLEASRLFAAPDDRAATLTDCAAAQDWMDRYATFGWYSIPGSVKAILEKQP